MLLPYFIINFKHFLLGDTFLYTLLCLSIQFILYRKGLTTFLSISSNFCSSPFFNFFSSPFFNFFSFCVNNTQHQKIKAHK